MSIWWDEDKGCYRQSLVHKLCYVWGWPIIRWAMFKLPSETAHHLAIRGIRLVRLLDRAWSCVVTVAIIVALVALYLLAILPGFSWKLSEGTPE